MPDAPPQETSGRERSLMNQQHLEDRSEPRQRLLTLDQVMEMTALSRSHIYNLIDRKLFPQGVRAGARAVRWWEHEVEAWMKSLPRATLRNLR